MWQRKNLKEIASRNPKAKAKTSKLLGSVKANITSTQSTGSYVKVTYNK